MSQCNLAKDLRRLKESSKEAVEGIEAFSEFKKYLHIERNVETELTEKLINVKKKKLNKQLVLVCGSVGDGKSHVISHINNNGSGLLDDFMIHNDATESNHPSKTYLETLDEKLEPFSDQQFNNGEFFKLIVAINLGTLSNFIEAEEYYEKYSVLRDYVKENKIIENEIVSSKESEYITYINFSDYALYELTTSGPKSSFIEKLLDKVVKNSSQNVFSLVYNNSCKEKCPHNELCPVKLNYEMLFDENLRKELSEIIISGIIKHKVILSVRSLLDFIYCIIVPRVFEEYSDSENLIDYFNEKNTYLELVKMLLPNLLYEQPKRSSLFNAVYKEDPLNDRTEIIDQMIIDVNISRKPLEALKDVFDGSEYNLLNSLVEKMTDIKNDSQVLIDTYLRFGKLSRHEILNTSDFYDNYMKYLYYYNNSNVRKYAELYQDVIKAIYAWNGYIDGDWVNISVTGQKSDFRLSHEIKIEPALIMLNDDNSEDDCSKFASEIRLNLKSKASKEIVQFVVDFDLYTLIMKVRQGYRLNHNDKEDYISFIESIDKLMTYGDKKETLRITHKKNHDKMDYILKQDMFGGYTFEPN